MIQRYFCSPWWIKVTCSYVLQVFLDLKYLFAVLATSELNNNSVVIFNKSMTVIYEFRSNGAAKLLEAPLTAPLLPDVCHLLGGEYQRLLHVPLLNTEHFPSTDVLMPRFFSQFIFNTFSYRKLWLKLRKVFIKRTHSFPHFIVHLRLSALQWSVFLFCSDLFCFALQQFIQQYFSLLRHGYDSCKVKVRLLCFKNKMLHQHFNLHTPACYRIWLHSLATQCDVNHQSTSS